MKPVRKAIIVIFLFFASAAESQIKNDIAFSTFTHYGKVIPTNAFLKGENRLNYPIKYFGDLSLRFEIQTNNSNYWHALYNFPSFGFGLDIINFKDRGLLKQPVAAYTFLSFSYLQSRRLDLRGEYALGLATNWDYFSPDNNLNVAIGSPLTCYFDYGLHLYYKINGYFDVGVGASMTHFSNGALRKPNRGINIISPRITVKYNASHLQKKPQTGINPRLKQFAIPEIKPFYLSFSIFGGVSGHYYHMQDYDIKDSIFRKEFLVGGISPALIYNFNIKYGLGLGLDFAYFSMADKSIAVENGEIVIKSEGSCAQRFNSAIFLAFEYRIHHFTLNIEPCLYLYKFKPSFKNSIFDTPVFYQRLGVRWQATQMFYIGLKLRTYRFSIAHFIEWNIGIRL